MYLKQLKLSSIRNLVPCTLEFSPHFNWIHGKNGSGKTSLLEAIYLLATGRSFRSRHAKDFIRHHEEACVVSGLAHSKMEVHSIRMGVERHSTTGLRLKMNEEPFEVLSEWVKVLPLQLINIDSYQLLTGPPNVRRQFLDWPMFHVEHSFYELLQRYRRALKQRNAALKACLQNSRRAGRVEIELWNKELSETGEAITIKRRQFISVFFKKFNENIDSFLKVDDINLEFQPGWNESLTLEEALLRSIDRDRVLGYTTVGPHRADFGFSTHETPVETVLSRGQLKMFMTNLFLARAEFVANTIEKAPLCLLDDLKSELDSDACARLLGGLLKLNSQLFVTGIERDLIFDLKEESGTLGDIAGTPKELLAHIKMFHVEHGILELDTLET